MTNQEYIIWLERGIKSYHDEIAGRQYSLMQYEECLARIAALPPNDNIIMVSEIWVCDGCKDRYLSEGPPLFERYEGFWNANDGIYRKWPTNLHKEHCCCDIDDSLGLPIKHGYCPDCHRARNERVEEVLEDAGLGKLWK